MPKPEPKKPARDAEKIAAADESDPSRFVLPHPIDLAKIAALLRGNDGPEESVRQAIALYIHAVIEREKFDGFSSGEIIAALNDEELYLWAKNKWEQSGSSKLRLYADNAKVDEKTRATFFKGDLDPVRQFLHEQADYLNMTKVRSVLNAIELYFLDKADQHNTANQSAIEKLEAQHGELAEQSGKSFQAVRNGMYIPAKELRQDGDALYKDYMNRRAIRSSGNGALNDSSIERVLYWELEQSFLLDLIAFRRNVKARPGGIKALAKKLRPSI